MSNETDKARRAGKVLRKPKGILLDFGDTVLRTTKWDVTAGTARMLELADKPHGLAVEDVQVIAADLAPEVDACRESSMIEFTSRQFQRLLYDRLDVTFSLAREKLEMEFWKAAVEHVQEPGIEDALVALRETGIPVGVVSNTTFTGEVLMAELAQHGLAKYFKFLMASADYGFRKPHPLLYLAAAARMRADPSDLWFVGNSLDYDVAGALKAGMVAIWYNVHEVPPGEVKPDAEIHHWSELIQLVERSVAGSHE